MTAMAVRSRRSQPISAKVLEALYREGRYADFARAYDDAPTPKAVLLRARVFLKNDAPVAIRTLLSATISKVDAPERDMLLGVAYGRLGEFDAADHYLGEAERGRSIGIRGELHYQRARRFLAEGRIEEARSESLALGETPGMSNEVLHLQSFIYSQQGRYRDQAQSLIELLQRISPESKVHMEMRAWATHTLGALARDLVVPEALPLVEQHLEGTLWPADFVINRFQALKGLGWAHALQGDYFNGFRYLKQAAEVAPDLAWKVVALADRAYLARSIGELRWSRQELDEAERIGERIDWHATKNEERIGLLLLAELFAPIDGARAAQYLGKNSELPSLRSPLMHYQFDDRPKALADYSTGIVHAHTDNKTLALSSLRRSRDAFLKFGYEWRAGRSMIGIFDVTKDAKELSAASEQLRHYLGSWFTEELRARGANLDNVALPPVQRKVFEALCEGQSPAQIASKMKRSEFTIRNHVKRIYLAFGVNSRAALMAEASRRRLT